MSRACVDCKKFNLCRCFSVLIPFDDGEYVTYFCYSLCVYVSVKNIRLCWYRTHTSYNIGFFCIKCSHAYLNGTERMLKNLQYILNSDQKPTWLDAVRDFGVELKLLVLQTWPGKNYLSFWRASNNFEIKNFIAHHPFLKYLQPKLFKHSMIALQKNWCHSTNKYKNGNIINLTCVGTVEVTEALSTILYLNFARKCWRKVGVMYCYHRADVLCLAIQTG